MDTTGLSGGLNARTGAVAYAEARGKLAGVLAKEVSVAGVEQVTGGGSG